MGQRISLGRSYDFEVEDEGYEGRGLSRTRVVPRARCDGPPEVL